MPKKKHGKSEKKERENNEEKNRSQRGSKKSDVDADRNNLDKGANIRCKPGNENIAINDVNSENHEAESSAENETEIKGKGKNHEEINGSDFTNDECDQFGPAAKLDALEENIVDVTGYIERKADEIRAKSPVNWLPYYKAGLITQRDYSFITGFQHTRSRNERDLLIDYFKEQGFQSFVVVVRRVCLVEEIQKFLVLIDDMLREDPSRVDSFKPEETHPWKVFSNLLCCTDPFVSNMAGRIVSKLITGGKGRPERRDWDFYMNWIKDELRHDNRYLHSVARCLNRMLRVDEYRHWFMDMNGVFRIVRLLSSGIKPQAQYMFCFNLWLASFNASVTEKMNRFGTIPVLLHLLEAAPAEISKLPRIVMALFRNLLEKPREEAMRRHNAMIMQQNKIAGVLHILGDRRGLFVDPEFRSDFEFVKEKIEEFMKEMSTFDAYLLELKGGRLEWSVVHNTPQFWSENAEKFNEKRCELLKILVEVAKTSKDSTALCIAAHDLGMYMTHYPGGRRIVEKLGGKEALLGLLEHHRSAEVKFHALKSLQILMLNSFDMFLEFLREQNASCGQHFHLE